MESEMSNEATKSAKRTKRPFLATLSVLFVFLFIALVVAFVLPSVVLRHLFSRVEAQSGIAITFNRAYFYLADGSFLNIEGLAIKRQNHHDMNLDLRAEGVQMPAMFPADFRSPVLLVTGLHGTIERVSSTPQAEGSVPANESERREERQEGVFIQALILNNSEINFIDRTLAQPFQTTIHVSEFDIFKVDHRSLFEPYVFRGQGQIGTARFAITHNPDDIKQQLGLAEVPFSLLAPYAPVLDDIFVSGSMNIQIDELSDETQKRLRINIWLLPDCRIKSADELLAPALQAALRQLDSSSVPELQDLQRRIERLRTNATSVRGELDRVTQIVDRLSALAPRNVREEYERFRSQYDRAMAAHDEWNARFETLLQDLDQVKVRIVEDTFRAFINSGTPIEIDLHEVDGEWQYDWYDVVIRLIERNYRTIIATQYQSRIQEIRDAVDRLLVP